MNIDICLKKVPHEERKVCVNSYLKLVKLLQGNYARMRVATYQICILLMDSGRNVCNIQFGFIKLLTQQCMNMIPYVVFFV